MEHRRSDISNRMGSKPDTCRGYCFKRLDDDRYVQQQCRADPPCQLSQCPNFPICGNAAPEMEMVGGGGRCIRCSDLFGRNLVIVLAPEACPVCLDKPKYSVVYVCGHTVCCGCFGAAMGVALPSYHNDVLPEQFGFVPPPMQPWLDYHDRECARSVALREWEMACPKAFRNYEFEFECAEDEHDERMRASQQALARACPMCRGRGAVFVRDAGEQGAMYTGLAWVQCCDHAAAVSK